MGKNVIREKSYEFAKETVRISKILRSEKEFVLSNQFLRCGTSVAANVREGVSAQSTKDFISKLEISLKEARESEFWIELMQDTGILDSSSLKFAGSLCDEVISLLVCIIVTTKRNHGLP